MDSRPIRSSAYDNWDKFYAALDTGLSRRQVAELFEQAGFACRKASWTGYELTLSWAQLTVEAEMPILLYGLVKDLPTNAAGIFGLLESAGISYEGECYDSGGELIREFRSGSAHTEQTP